MINVGRQMKAGFRSVLQEQGQEVVIISNWKTPFQVIHRVKGVKSNKEGRPDYSVFQFTEAFSIENGSVIYVPKSDTYWRVYETEDRILGNVYVLFEAKTNKTWLEMDEKEFDELILGAKAPDGALMEGAAPAPAPAPRSAPVLNFTPPKPVAPIKLKTEEEKWAEKAPPPASESQVETNQGSAGSASSESSQPEEQGDQEVSSNHESEQPEATSGSSSEITDPKTAGESDTPKAFEPKPRHPFRKRSDQLYVSRQIRNLISAIPKAELDERMKSETISALKAIEGLLVPEVTEREKSQAEKRLEIVIGALDRDLEFAVNVAAYLPPIFTYFGLEIN